MISFSVAMCVYKNDNPDWFRVAVNSVLNQTVKPNEVILVVDGPIPDTILSVIDDYKKLSFFKVIFLEKNVGHGNARRIGIENCSNELIALMDSDDICVENRFEQQLLMFENDPKLSIVGGQVAEFIDEPSNIKSYRMVPVSNEQIGLFLKKRCPFNQPSVIFKKEDILRVGGYLDWYCNEDYYLWIRMFLANYKMCNLPNVLVNMRISSDTFKRRGGYKYYQSEKKLQKFMLENKVINKKEYIRNVFVRWVVQVLMPNNIRACVFKIFARNKK